MTEWRTVQFFLTANGVCEVQLNAEKNLKTRCTCKSKKNWFGRFWSCQHIAFVKKNISSSGSAAVYSLVIPENVPDEVAESAIADNEEFRNFVLKYGKVASID